MMYPKEVKNLMRIVEELDYYGAIEVKSNFYGREEEKEEDSGYHSGYHSVSYHYDHDTKQWEKSSIEQYG
ncbi:MAG: hypothetical protein LBU27_01305 [Candidatus Peribacteria bacterium]|nr:hypothetical protein [Candidatus Peribacteria bacterium]